MRRLLLIPLLLVGCGEENAAPSTQAPSPPTTTTQQLTAADACVHLWDRRDRDRVMIVSGFDYETDPPTSYEHPPIPWRDGERALLGMQGFFDEAVRALSIPVDENLQTLDGVDPDSILANDRDALNAMRGMHRMLRHEAVRRARAGDGEGATEMLRALLRASRHLAAERDHFSVWHASLAVSTTVDCIEIADDVCTLGSLEDDLGAFDEVDPCRFEEAFRRTALNDAQFLRRMLDEPVPGAAIAAHLNHVGLEEAQIKAVQDVTKDAAASWNGRIDVFELTVVKQDRQPVAALMPQEIEARIDTAERQIDVVIRAMKKDDAGAMRRVADLMLRDESQILKFVLGLNAVTCSDQTRDVAVELAALRERLQ